MLFKNALGRIRENRDRKMSGELLSIPFGMKRFQRLVPGVQKQKYYIVTANSGVGKSKVTKYLFVFNAFHTLWTRGMLSKIKYTVKYFCLEESKMAFAHSFMCFALYKHFSVRISIEELNSMLNPDDPTAVVDEDILKKLDSLEPYFKAFEESVDLIDEIFKPYAIYKHCTDYLEAIGDYNMKYALVYDPKQAKEVMKWVKDSYFMTHPDHYVIFVLDHMSLIQPEKGQDLHEAIRILSSKYFVNLRNYYGASIIAVQQQASDQEKQQFTYKGASIESKLEPSLSGLGDCKLTQRDADIVLGVFAPDRYEIPDHRGYDITRLKDNYRSISVLKFRDGEANKRLSVFFDGAVNYIAELPESKAMTPVVYDKVLTLSGRKPKT